MAHNESSPPGILEIKDFIDSGPKITVTPAEHKGRALPHSHGFYEIVYVSDGFTLHQSCGKITMLITGDLFFVKPGEVHSYINAYQTKLYNLLFDSSALGLFLDELSVLPGLSVMFSPTEQDSASDPTLRLIHVSIGERRNIEASLEKMLSERRDKNVGWEVSLCARLTSFLIKYSRMYSEQYFSASEKLSEIGGDSVRLKSARSNNDYYGYIYKLLCYIDQHYAENLTMNDLSAVTGLSPDYMARKFKAILGMTPSEYVRKFRIAKAMELLCTTELTVSEISQKTGFSDVSLFSRVFKQNVGLPPASYRKNSVE